MADYPSYGILLGSTQTLEDGWRHSVAPSGWQSNTLLHARQYYRFSLLHNLSGADYESLFATYTAGPRDEYTLAYRSESPEIAYLVQFTGPPAIVRNYGGDRYDVRVPLRGYTTTFIPINVAAVSGVSASMQAGAPSISGIGNTSVSGLSAGGAVGAVGIGEGTSDSASVSGLAATGQVGAATAGISVTQVPSSIQATGFVDSVNVTGEAVTVVSGSQGTGAVGTVTSALKNNLLAAYELDESSGTRVDSHNSNDLSDFNTVGSESGMGGTAATFVSANSERLERTSFDVGTGSFSVAGWFNHTSGQAGDHRPIQMRGTGTIGSGVPGFFMKWRSASGFVQAYAGNCGIEDSSGNSVVWSSSVAFGIANDTWFHWAFTVDRTADEMKMFVNAVQKGSTRDISSVTGSLNTSRKFTLGGSDVTSSQFWDGAQAGLWVWDRALDATDVTAHYNSGSILRYADL
jgi:hypothetical protein